MVQVVPVKRQNRTPHRGLALMDAAATIKPTVVSRCPRAVDGWTHTNGPRCTAALADANPPSNRTAIWVAEGRHVSTTQPAPMISAPETGDRAQDPSRMDSLTVPTAVTTMTAGGCSSSPVQRSLLAIITVFDIGLSRIWVHQVARIGRMAVVNLVHV